MSVFGVISKVVQRVLVAVRLCESGFVRVLLQVEDFISPQHQMETGNRKLLYLSLKQTQHKKKTKNREKSGK